MTDPGGVGTGMQEKNVVLDVSKRFKALLDADTADTAGGGKWTVADDARRRTCSSRSPVGRRTPTTKTRIASCRSTPTRSATRPPTAPRRSRSPRAAPRLALRNLVQAEMLAAWKLTNRGNKIENFAVLRETACPAVLHELAFITNATDAAKLASPAERQKAAEAHLRAIQRHYNITPYIPGGGGTTPPQDTDGEIAGHVTDGTGPVVGATVKLDGGASVLTDAEGAFVFTKAKVGASHGQRERRWLRIRRWSTSRSPHPRAPRSRSCSSPAAPVTAAATAMAIRTVSPRAAILAMAPVRCYPARARSPR